MSSLNSYQLHTLSLAEPFKGLDKQALELVAEKCDLILYPAHAIIFKQGDISDGIYVIETGQISITKDNALDVAVNGPNETIGSLTQNKLNRRSASAQTIKASSVIKFSKQAFLHLSQDYPDIFHKIELALVTRTHRLYLGFVMRINPFLAKLPAEILVAIENIGTISQVKNGDILWEQGEPSTFFYIVITGRLRIWHNSPITIKSGLQKEIGPSETVGELGTITKENRQAGLRAIRDSTIAKITRDQLTELLTLYPDEINTLLVNIVSNHLSTPYDRHQHAKNASNTIALIPIDENVTIKEIGKQLDAALSINEKTLVVDSESINHLLDIPGFSQSPLDNTRNFSFLNWLNDIEFKHNHVILVADTSYSNWTRRCIHQADHLLFIAHSSNSPHIGHIEDQILTHEKHLGIRKSLLLIHPEQTTVPQNTQAWLAERKIGMHHHLREHNTDDFSRLARFLTGRSVGLVLGGGAARGFAHIGVLRALKEKNIPIDLIGGTSMGALIAAQYAMQKELHDITQDTLALCLAGDKLTIPLVSLYEGYKMSKGLKKFFGDFAIEDLWCKYYSVSCNLSRASVMTHDSGAVLDAVIASNIPPGLFPPKVINGDLFVDGGLLNNVPIDIMTNYNEGGTLIAVDVNPKNDLIANTHYQDGLSGWQVLQHKINPLKKNMHIPSILDVLMRSTAIGGLAQQKSVTTDIADLFLQPPVAHYPLLGYKKAEKIVESGYKYALDQIAKVQFEL